MGLVSKLFKGDSGWFAARPSGTESISKLYAKSLKNADHLTAIVEQVQEIVRRSLGRK
jgi:phosphoglucomutase